jgi:hypothetical protein
VYIGQVAWEGVSRVAHALSIEESFGSSAYGSDV